MTDIAELNAELLECLRYAVDNIQGIADGNDAPSIVIRERARAAIAKAEGEPEKHDDRPA